MRGLLVLENGVRFKGGFVGVSRGNWRTCF